MKWLKRTRFSVAAVILLLSLILSACSGFYSPPDTPLDKSSDITVSTSINTGEEDALTVHFLDVGQGNAVLAQCGGKSMLIDGGDRDTSSFVVSYLKKQGIEKLDYIVASHYDADHLSGIVGALHVFDVGTVLAPNYESDTNIYRSYTSILKEKGCTPVHPLPGDTYPLGDASFTVVCPDCYDYVGDNNNSVGIHLSLGDNSFLLLGDAEKESEQAMLETGRAPDSDVLLVSHHGSGGSSTEKFLQAIKPSYAVISSGSNSYGHPAEHTLKRLKAIGVNLYRTDVQGTILAQTDGKTLSFSTSPTDDWTPGYRSKSSKSPKPGSSSSISSDGDTGTDGSSTEDSSASNSTPGSSSAEDYYIGNEKTKKFHRPDCSGLPDKKNQVIFKKRSDAKKDGYSPCKRCNP